MAIFNFSSTVKGLESYCTPSLRYIVLEDFIEDDIANLVPFGFIKSLNNIVGLSDDLYVPFNASTYNTIRGNAWGPRTPHRGQVYGRGGGKIPVELNNYFNTPKQTQNRSFVFESYNSLPVRGWLYIPPTSNPSYDVILLYHGTISTEGVTPYNAAERFLNIALSQNKLSLEDKIIFSVAYPQDTVPSWNTELESLNQGRADSQFPGIQISNFYLGDNLAYAEAALLWVMNNLDSYLSSNGFGTSVDKIYTFGHSQGGSLVHKLNTLHTIDGVILNAPGPIDLLTTCAFSEDTNDSIFSCRKLKSGFFSTDIEPDKYNSISLTNYLTGLKSPSLYIQALDDTTGNNNGAPQVFNMQNILEPGLNDCMDCAPYTFNYYDTGGHEAFVTNSQVQQDIRAFVGSGG